MTVPVQRGVRCCLLPGVFSCAFSRLTDSVRADSIASPGYREGRGCSRVDLEPGGSRLTLHESGWTDLNCRPTLPEGTLYQTELYSPRWGPAVAGPHCTVWGSQPLFRGLRLLASSHVIPFGSWWSRCGSGIWPRASRLCLDKATHSLL